MARPAAFMLGVILVTFVVRSILVALLRIERMPRAAAAVDAGWVWVPLVVVVGGAWWYLGPLGGTIATVAAGALVAQHLRRTPADPAGSP